MKNLIYSLTLLNLTYVMLLGGIVTVFSQTTGIPYQAYITTNIDVPGEEVVVPLANTEILLEFVVKDEHGNIEYIEHISVTTDEYGLVSTVVGAGYGTPQNSTNFSDIDWNGLSKTLDMGIDFSNAGDFTDHSQMPIMYIPSPTTTTTEGLVSSTGAPTATNPANPEAGDIYVDEATGYVYTFNSTTHAWESQHETLTSLTVETNDNGSPTDTSDDYDQLVYTNENKDKNNIDIRSFVKASNGLSVVTSTVELGGALTKPTDITTSMANTLSITGLTEETAFNPNEDQVVVLDQHSGILKRSSLAALFVQKENVWVAANDGETDFDTPLIITSIEKVNVFRNGARVGFTALDNDTIKLEAEATCFKGDEIRIVQLQ